LMNTSLVLKETMCNRESDRREAVLWMASSRRSEEALNCHTVVRFMMFWTQLN
jgi:hypothetical protein